MLLKPEDLSEIAGQGGGPFESVLYDTVIAEARRHGISPSQVQWDYRTNVADGGRDIVISADHSDNVDFIPKARSVWSAKSGVDGTRPTTLRSELCDASRIRLREHLRNGGSYVWCCPRAISQEERSQMSEKAVEVAIELGIRPEQIEFRWDDALAATISNHLSIVVLHFPLAAKRISELMTISEWKQLDGGFSSQWVSISDRDSLVEMVRSHLHGDGEQNVLHVTGLSGIGKTRTVLEACLSDDLLGGVIYIRQPLEPESALMRYLKVPNRSAYVVIDEFPLSGVDSFRSQVAGYSNRLRFVTIGPSRSNASNRFMNTAIHQLQEPRSNEDVLRIVNANAMGLGEEVRRSIAELSHHDLRLALMLVQATLKSDELRNVPLRNCDDLWNRIVSQHNDHIGDLNRFRERYELLTSTIDIGIAKDHRAELKFISEYFKINTGEFEQAIKRATECGLGVETPYFFEAVPRALATWLFSDRVWTQIKHELAGFFDKMPTDRMRRRFMERCSNCEQEIRSHVEAEISDFFFRRLGTPRILALQSRRESRLFSTWVELCPDRGLSWLKQAIHNATESDLRKFDGSPDGSGGWHGRRQIVWLCENMAAFAEHFWDCESILFDLAKVETELSIGNNSTNTWKQMYWLVLSHTEVPFQHRLDHLLKRISNADFETVDLIIHAAFGILHSNNGRMAPPSVVGGRIVPIEWRPSNLRDLAELRSKAAQQVLSTIKGLTTELRSRSIAIAITELRVLARWVSIDQLRKFFDDNSMGDTEIRSLRFAIDDLLGDYEIQLRQGRMEFADRITLLTQWTDGLAPEDLQSQIKELTSRSYWSARQVARKASVNLDPDLQYDAMAKEILSDPQILHELEFWFGSDDAKSGTELAFSIGTQDKLHAVSEVMLTWLLKRELALTAINYLQGLSRKGPGLPSNIDSVLADVAKENPDAAFLAYVRADISTHGFACALALVNQLSKPRSRHLLEFQRDAWTKELRDDQKQLVANTLLSLDEDGDKQAIGTALTILTQWCEHGRSQMPAALRDQAWKMLQVASQKNRQIGAHEWQVIIKQVAEHHAKDAANLIAEILSDLKQTNSFHSDSAVETLTEIGQSHPRDALDAISNHSKSNKNLFALQLHDFRDLMQKCDKDVLKTWILENKPRNAKFAARNLPSPFVDDDGVASVPELTEWFLNEFEAEEPIFREFCEGRHANEVKMGGPEDWGPAIRRTAEAFLNHPNRRVRDWAKFELAHLQDEARFHAHIDDEFTRG